MTGSRLETTLKKARITFGSLLLNVDKVARLQSRACKMAPYKVRERDIWLCDTHYADWLEHEWEVSHQ